jgi:hypothetical protein
MVAEAPPKDPPKKGAIMQSLDQLKISAFWDPGKVGEVLYSDEDRLRASNTLQKLWRERWARKIMVAFRQSLYEKLWDKTTQQFYYVNRHTEEMSWEKPKLLLHYDMLSPQEIESAVLIQGLYRTRHARRRIHQMVQKCFEKKKDRDSGYYYYLNVQSGESSWEKPLVLGQGDIHTPRTAHKHELWDEEKQTIKDRRQQEHEERAVIMKEDHLNYLSIKEKKLKHERDEAVAELNTVIGHSIKIARVTGDLNAAWMPLPRIPPVILSITELVALRMVGDDLCVLPDTIGECLPNLEVMNFSCNKLQGLPHSICKLVKLKELNLMKNRIVEMPDNLGALTNLTDLELANNQIRSLPESFGDLRNVPKINLELNHLESLPNSMGMLLCKILNLSKNRLTSLPPSFGNMKKLQHLYLNFNLIEQLPNEIGNLKQLQDFSICNNRLVRLPETIGQLKKLQRLWLDWNRLSGLPWTFGRCKKLRELKIEGNEHMVYPGMQIISQGVKATLDWCDSRVVGNVERRRKRLLFDLMNCMEQIKLYSLAHHENFLAYFEPDINYADMGDVYYSFQVEQLFTKMLPALERHWRTQRREYSMRYVTEFDYSRQHVEEALSTHHDVNGPIAYFDAPELCFQRCQCQHPDGHPQAGQRRVCVPPKVGGASSAAAPLTALLYGPL